MDWIHNYQLFLFDFDGLLVDTERLHYKAYRAACQGRGFDLAWDFERYIMAAHYRAEGLEEQIYGEFPLLKELESDWSVIYAEKKANYIRLLKEDSVPLMPGAEQLLIALRDADVPRCVVTHSAGDLVKIIREKNPVLNTIPHWITREHYDAPKPSPECYQAAIKAHAGTNDAVIGFEDSPRGMAALLGSRAKPVLVSPMDHPGISQLRDEGVSFFRSLEKIPRSGP
jgi:beta-phosphoglucomutase